MKCLVMNVLLFNPPGPDGKGFTREGRCTQEAGIWKTHWPPVSLATSAAMIEREGHCARTVDFPASGFAVRGLIEAVRKIRPSLAVWSTGTPSLPFDLGIAELIRKHSSGTLTAVIGTHVTILPEEALLHPGLDMVIRGEPEKIIRNLSAAGGGWKKVRGISYREPDGKTVHNPPEDLLDPEEIPFPAWHGMDLQPYRLPLKGTPFLIVAPTRGCPYHCSFCTAPLYYGSKLRERPVEKVVEEMRNNGDRYGVTEFFIWADTFTARKEYVMSFCRAIQERKLRISWTCNSRVDTVDGEMLEAMKEAGLWMISFGIESANDKILALAGKGISAKQSREAVQLANRTGLKTAGHFIFGLPGETEQTMQETLSMALELPLDIAQFYAAAPFPGTRLYDAAVRNGWLTEADGEGSSLNCSQVSAGMDLPGLPAQRVNDFLRLAYKRFYARPRAFLNVLSMVEPGVVRLAFSGWKRFAGSNRGMAV